MKRFLRSLKDDDVGTDISIQFRFRTFFREVDDKYLQWKLFLFRYWNSNQSNGKCRKAKYLENLWKYLLWFIHDSTLSRDKFLVEITFEKSTWNFLIDTDSKRKVGQRNHLVWSAMEWKTESFVRIESNELFLTWRKWRNESDKKGKVS